MIANNWGCISKKYLGSELNLKAIAEGQICRRCWVSAGVPSVYRFYIKIRLKRSKYWNGKQMTFSSVLPSSWLSMTFLFLSKFFLSLDHQHTRGMLINLSMLRIHLSLRAIQSLYNCDKHWHTTQFSLMLHSCICSEKWQLEFKLFGLTNTDLTEIWDSFMVALWIALWWQTHTPFPSKQHKKDVCSIP